MTLRPHSRLTTAELQSLVDTRPTDLKLLLEVFRELLFRERKAARDLHISLVKKIVRTGEYFPWTTTYAPPSAGGPSDIYIPYDKGLLGCIGYRVGTQGAVPSKRRDLLDFAYAGTLPNVNSPDYMKGWGMPKSATRLRKVTESIAAFARNAKRNPRKSSVAIEEWEADLLYLKAAHYLGRYSFPWPDTIA